MPSWFDRLRAIAAAAPAFRRRTVRAGAHGSIAGADTGGCPRLALVLRHAVERSHAVALLSASACDIRSAPQAVIEEVAADGVVVRLMADIGLPPRLIVGESMRLVVLAPEGPEVGEVEVLEPCEPPLGRPRGRCYRLSLPTAIEGFQRRGHARVKLPLDCRARVELAVSGPSQADASDGHAVAVGRVLDLSESGLRAAVVARRSPWVGELLHGTIRFPAPLPPLAAEVEVVHAMQARREDERILGLRFAHPCEGLREALVEIGRRRATRAGRTRAG